jgi:hypothetical protein
VSEFISNMSAYDLAREGMDIAFTEAVTQFTKDVAVSSGFDVRSGLREITRARKQMFEFIEVLKDIP